MPEPRLTEEQIDKLLTRADALRLTTHIGTNTVAIREAIEREDLEARGLLVDVAQALRQVRGDLEVAQAKAAEWDALRALPVFAEYGRLDAMWQELVAERDEYHWQRDAAREQVRRLREVLGQVAADYPLAVKEAFAASGEQEAK